MTQDVQRFHAAMAEASHLAARSLRELARSFEMAADAHDALRGHLAAREEEARRMAEAVESRELRDTVYPEGARADAKRQDAGGPQEWGSFLDGLHMTPVEAVQAIRAELPTALRAQNTDEDADWPKVPAEGEPHEIRAATDMELQRAASKLTSLPASQALAAQEMLTRLRGRQ